MSHEHTLFKRCHVLAILVALYITVVPVFLLVVKVFIVAKAEILEGKFSRGID